MSHRSGTGKECAADAQARAVEGECAPSVGNGCWRSVATYWAVLPRHSQEILRTLLDLPIGMIEHRCDFFYLSRIIAPFAGDGFHTRLARGFMQWTNGLDIEFYAPRRAATYGVTEFEPTDVSKLLNSAAQGDVVIFRSRDRRALHAVEKFFRESPLMKERSKGDS